MFRFALLICVIASFWNNQVNGFTVVDGGIEVKGLGQYDVSDINLFTEPMGTKVVGVIFGMKLVFLRDFAHGEIRRPAGTQIFIALVKSSNPRGVCLLHVTLTPDWQVNRKEPNEINCKDPTEILNKIGEIKKRFSKVLDWIKKHEPKIKKQ